MSWVEDDEVLSLPPGPWRDVNGLHEAGPAVPILDRVNTKNKSPVASLMLIYSKDENGLANSRS